MFPKEKYIELQKELKTLIAELRTMKEAVEKDGRQPTQAERDRAGEILDRLNIIEPQVMALDITVTEPQRKPTRPDVSADGGFSPINNSLNRIVTDMELPPLYPGEDKSYRSMFFGAKADITLDYGGFTNLEDLYRALVSKKKRRVQYMRIVYTYAVGMFYAIKGGRGLYRLK